MQDTNLFTNNQVKSSRIIYTPSSFARSNLLYLQETGTLQAQAPHTSRRDNLSSFLFFVVTEGSGTLVYNDIVYQLTKGDCVFINCKTRYSQCSSEDLWSLSWCHFYGSNLLGIYNKYIERGGMPVFRPKDTLHYQVLLDDIYSIAASVAYTRDMHIYDKLTSLLTFIMEESWRPEPQSEPVALRRDMLEIKEFIDANYADKITLESLAGTFYISKHYLARRFKEQCGMTVINYIYQVRVTHAKHMLRFTNDSIELIAEKCGVSDANYFSRTFKKVEGVSPAEYRRSWKAL